MNNPLDGGGQSAPEERNKYVDNTEWALYEEVVIGAIFL